MIAMRLTKPGTETEATVLVTCEKCGDVIQYGAACEANWIAVGGGPWRYRCTACRPETVTFTGDMLNQCDGCRRGLPVDENGNHVGEGYDMIGCTRGRYENQDS